ncbi:MAG TPA: S-ribosylhomocysteine lyase [Treponema sp.]|nr:S-ribosylhomocysteine lyase [Treponema sp.]
MKESRNVESFNLDHTKVQAPYVRLAGTVKGPQGDVVSKYDVRFCQPNEDVMSTAAMHTLEHLMAEYIRDELEGVIDLSPMGCRTGFYLAVFGSQKESVIAEKLRAVLAQVVAWPDEETVPGVDPVMCGNWKDHDLAGAREWASRWIEGIDSKGWACC